jgi:hypothetical protein
MDKKKFAEKQKELRLSDKEVAEVMKNLQDYLHFTNKQKEFSLFLTKFIKEFQE